MKNYFLISLFFMVLATIPVYGMESQGSWVFRDYYKKNKTVTISSNYFKSTVSKQSLEATYTFMDLEKISKFFHRYESNKLTNIAKIIKMLHLLHPMLANNSVNTLEEIIWEIWTNNVLHLEATIGAIGLETMGSSFAQEFRNYVLIYLSNLIKKVLIKEKDENGTWNKIADALKEKLVGEDESEIFKQKLHFVLRVGQIVKKAVNADVTTRSNESTFQNTHYYALLCDLIKQQSSKQEQVEVLVNEEEESVNKKLDSQRPGSSVSEDQWHDRDILNGETISIASKYLKPDADIRLCSIEELRQIKTCIESYEEATVLNYNFQEICSLLLLLNRVVIDEIIDDVMNNIYYQVIDSKDIRRDAVNIVESIIKDRTVSDEFKESFINHFYLFILKILREHDKDFLFESIIERAHEELHDKNGFYVHRLYFVIYSSVIIAQFYLPDNEFRNEILLDIKNSVALDGTVYKDLCNDLIDIRPQKSKIINFLRKHPRAHFAATAALSGATTLAWCAPYIYKNDSLNKAKLAGIFGAGVLTTGLTYYLKEGLVPKKLLGSASWSSIKEQQALITGTGLAFTLCAGIKYLPLKNAKDFLQSYLK